MAQWTGLYATVANARSDIELDGVLVEAMAAKGLEPIVGARNDEDWGQVVIVGLGGVWAEALHDTCILPADRVRGTRPADVDAVAAWSIDPALLLLHIRRWRRSISIRWWSIRRAKERLRLTP